MATQRLSNNINNNNEVAVDIPGPEELIDAAANELGGNSRQLARPLFWVGSWTLMIVFNRIVSGLPDPGGVFQGHQVAYCLTLFGVFLAGVAEVYAAIRLSSAQAQDGGRGRAYTNASRLLCASVVLLLAAIVALDGSPVLVMG